MFSLKTYSERRKKITRQFDDGILFFMGNNESSMNYADNTYHFRQDSSFLYFFGLDLPNLAAFIDCHSGTEYIIGDDLTMDMIVWMGTHPKIKTQAEKVGVKKVLSWKEAEDYFQNVKSKKIRILPQYRADNLIKISKLFQTSIDEVKNNVSVSFIKAVANLRNYKSKEEIEEINKAVSISADMHIAAMKFAKPGMKEYEVAAKIMEVAKSNNASLSFPIICTVNGQTLHNHYHGNELKTGQMLLIDAGAETAMHYAGDLSHTFPVDKKFTEQQKLIYQIALDAHNEAVNKLTPGVKMLDVHFAACRKIAEGLKNIGLMKGNLEEAVNLGAHALFFPCGTGHMMGLDVHDMENFGEQYVGYTDQLKKEKNLFGLKSLRLGRELEPGFVLTIEPGIYFIPELINMWKAENKFSDFINYSEVEKFKDFSGCRSEEDFLITESGHRLLGKEVPKEINLVEAMRAE